MRFALGPTPQNNITGWLTPDNPTLTPRFRVENEAGSFVVEADCLRPDLVEAMMHETGMVGFNFGDHNVPGITTSTEVVVTELTQHKVIYRRTARTRTLPAKLFIFNTLPVPSQMMRKDLAGQFAVAYAAIDGTGIETALSLLGNGAVESIFSEGRLSLMEHLPFLRRNGYVVAALLNEPFNELANRLLVVRTLLTSGREALLSALSPSYTALKDCAQQLDDCSTASINAIFSSLGQDQKTVVMDPMARALACHAGEDPEPRHVAMALTLLSDLDAVGISTQIDTFQDTLEPLVSGLYIANKALPGVQGAAELEEVLRASPVVNRLLRNDLRLYAYAEKAIAVAE